MRVSSTFVGTHGAAWLTGPKLAGVLPQISRGKARRDAVYANPRLGKLNGATLGDAEGGVLRSRVRWRRHAATDRADGTLHRCV